LYTVYAVMWRPLIACRVLINYLHLCICTRRAVHNLLPVVYRHDYMPQPCTSRTSWKLVANPGCQPGFPTSCQLVSNPKLQIRTSWQPGLPQPTRRLITSLSRSHTRDCGRLYENPEWSLLTGELKSVHMKQGHRKASIWWAVRQVYYGCDKQCRRGSVVNL